MVLLVAMCRCCRQRLGLARSSLPLLLLPQILLLLTRTPARMHTCSTYSPSTVCDMLRQSIEAGKGGPARRQVQEQACGRCRHDASPVRDVAQGVVLPARARLSPAAAAVAPPRRPAAPFPPPCPPPAFTTTHPQAPPRARQHPIQEHRQPRTSRAASVCGCCCPLSLDDRAPA